MTGVQTCALPIYLVLKGARGNNLKNITVKIPLGTFTCITGVSGSGKSTLINETLYRALARQFYHAKSSPLEYDSIQGLTYIDKVINIDQSPIGRTPRSNSATYTGVFTYIRDLFAQLPEAKIRGYKPGRFSFNVKGGRCEACRGDGIITIEMYFLPNVYVACEVCKGERYSRDTLEIKYKGKSIADVLNMTVCEALEFLGNIPRVKRKLRTLCDVGLGYIRLGQPATTLSGGEAQRVKLSTELSKVGTGNTLYLLDEPTTGQDPARARHTRQLILKMKEEGKTIFLTTHNMAEADEICDRVGFLTNGHIPVSGVPDDLKRQYGQRILEVTTGRAKGAKKHTFPMENIGKNAKFLKLLDSGKIVSMHTMEASLDDVFIKVTEAEAKKGS